MFFLEFLFVTVLGIYALFFDLYWPVMFLLILTLSVLFFHLEDPGTFEHFEGRSAASRKRLTDSFARLGDVMTGGGRMSRTVVAEEFSGDDILLDTATFQKYTETTDSAEAEVVFEEFPLDDMDRTFRIDPKDPYYSSNIARMQEEYPKIMRVLQTVSRFDPENAKNMGWTSVM